MSQSLDSTLRGGEQASGVWIHEHATPEPAWRPDRFGVDVVEVGHSVISPRIRKAAERAALLKANACIATYTRTYEANVELSKTVSSCEGTEHD